MEWNSLQHSLWDPAQSTIGFRWVLITNILRRNGTSSALEALCDTNRLLLLYS